MRRFHLFIFFTVLLSLSTYSKDVIDGIVYDTYGANHLATVIGFEDVGEEVIVPSTITLVEYGKDVIYTVVGIRKLPEYQTAVVPNDSYLREQEEPEDY